MEYCGAPPVEEKKFCDGLADSEYSEHEINEALGEEDENNKTTNKQSRNDTTNDITIQKLSDDKDDWSSDEKRNDNQLNSRLRSIK